MDRTIKSVILLILILFLFTMFIGCNSQDKSKGNFNIEEFQSEMKEKNYSFEVKDVDKDFLPAKRKRIIVGNEALDIYLFSSNKKMESEAKHIDSDGAGYDNGFKSIMVEWSSSPHFYKRGKIIVQYVGENEKIISDLKDILGEQFAGKKDIREMAYHELSSKDKERIAGTWKDSKFSKITLREGMGNISDKSYIGKEVYLIDFPTKSKSKPNNIIVYIAMDSYKLLGYGYLD